MKEENTPKVDEREFWCSCLLKILYLYIIDASVALYCVANKTTRQNHYCFISLVTDTASLVITLIKYMPGATSSNMLR